MTCAEIGSYVGAPIRCDLNEGHEEDHWDKRRHYKWHWVASRKRRKADIQGTWTDPFNPIERWFSHLPNMSLREDCHCGSLLPVIYWSPEEGTGCDKCRNSFQIYSPQAVMYNIMDKFNIPRDLAEKIYEICGDK